MQGIKRLLRILTALALAVIATVIQGHWAMGGYHDQLSATCMQCSLTEELLWSGSIPALATGILLAVFHWRRPSRGTQVLTACLVMMVLWLLIDREIFISRVSSWSTFTTPEEWAATVRDSLVPILVTGAAFGAAFYLVARKYDHKPDQHMLRTLMFVFFACSSSLMWACNGAGVPSAIDNVFDSLPYDSAVAYSYDGEAGVEIIEDGKLANKIRQRKKLQKSQVTALTNVLCSASTYGGDMAACFDPHFGLVFYNAGRPEAYVSICLDCNYLVSSVNIPASKGGFSDEGVGRIQAFGKKLNFTK